MPLGFLEVSLIVPTFEVHLVYFQKLLNKLNKKCLFQFYFLVCHISNFLPNIWFQVENGEKAYKCQLCPMIFKSYPKITEHIAEDHQGKREYSCRFCKKIFTRSDGKLRHERFSCLKGSILKDKPKVIFLILSRGFHFEIQRAPSKIPANLPGQFCLFGQILFALGSS